MSDRVKKKKGFSCSRSFFEKLVKEAVAALPKEFRKYLENVAIIVEEDVTEEFLKPNQELLGLYQGVPKKERGFWYGNALPDRIVIYKRPIEKISSHLEELKENIRQTVLHEIGHYFGLEERELQSLEED